MVRIAILGILIVAFILLVRSFFPSRKEENSGSSDATEMVRDPNCGTYIPRGEALVKHLQGRDYFFCGEKCAKEFAETGARG
ncbi:MAG: hypothetical protein GWM98_19635 [Nitrospinaceae bacterium]|nr:hypothetical protein [Nitrospinaceae bacterium]NIR56287.1 hypothetical protein [Nitrospinaceae bacterium]NIS86744.1 hypothetical protein [Nitrospinaceae bacterium]NIT83579.1 hypothetical protein [Nitrospinaceae bacterium]NIU45781.1 hypothetical protein [Nitrospinaceae bacterium]